MGPIPHLEHLAPRKALLATSPLHSLNCGIDYVDKMTDVAESATDTVGLLHSMSQTVLRYEILLQTDFHSAGDHFDVTRTQVLTQRASLKYVHESFKSTDGTLKPHATSLLQHSLLVIHKKSQKIALVETNYNVFEGSGLKAASSPQKTEVNVQKTRWTAEYRERTRKSLAALTSHVDNLEPLLTVEWELSSDPGHPSSIERKGALQAPLWSNIPLAGDISNMDTQAQKTQETLRALCMNCEKIF